MRKVHALILLATFLSSFFLTTLAYASNTPSNPSNSNDSHFQVEMNGNGFSMSVPNAPSNTSTSNNDPLANLFVQYKKVGRAVLGIGIITALIFLLIEVTKLGAAGDNQQMRAKAIKGILVSGFVIAAFGSLELVVGIFWNTFG